MMKLDEAKRRLESAAIACGYQTTGRWTEKMHEDEPQDIHSMALTNMPQTRLVVWQSKGEWWGMISVQVGGWGEFPITGSTFTSEIKPVLSRHKFMWPRIEQVQLQVARWKHELAYPFSDKAMMKLAIHHLKQMHIKKALSILYAAVRGELEAASVSEALSIVQWKFYKTKEEMMLSARIWGEVFR